MDKDLIERRADLVLRRLGKNTIELEASGRHVHLSEEDAAVLFGAGYSFKKKADLSQPGQFACEERVTLKGPKRSIENVAILGPARAATQVEISATDAVALGIKAPVRMSGQIENTPGAVLVGPEGALELSQGVIIAKRHIHATPSDAARLGLKDKEQVDVTVYGERSLTFHNVVVRVSPDYATFMHIDHDEANACGFYSGMQGFINQQTAKPVNIAAALQPLAETVSPEPAEERCCPAEESGGALDLSGLKLISERELVDKYSSGMNTVLIAQKALITPLAMDFIRNKKLSIERR
jgi:propanediol utilization protein